MSFFKSAISLSLIILQSSAQIQQASDFGPDAESSVSALGRIREIDLNCFVQMDRLFADKWTLKLDPDPSVTDRFNAEEEEETGESKLTVDRKILLDNLGSCMKNVTKNLNDSTISECMGDLLASELEYDGVISLPELFDDTLPLPFLTFLDFNDLVKLLKLKNDSFIHKVASEYVAKENSDRDRVFVIDQSCEWKNLYSLQIKRDKGIPEMLKEFRQQVVRSLSLQIAHAVFQAKDLRPGTWITVYRRWYFVRTENLMELDTVISDLKKRTFTIDQLCKYATVLATNFAEYELKVLLPKRSSPLKLTTGELKGRTEITEKRICGSVPAGTKSCSDFKMLKNSFEDDLKCLETFGELLSNHILNSIIEKYADFEPRIRYPEIVCKKTAPLGSIAVRYCRCVGSFCTFKHVGHLNADSYTLDNGSLVLTGV